MYKKSSKPLSKEWKKKYVTLDEGRLTYHPSINVGPSASLKWHGMGF